MGFDPFSAIATGIGGLINTVSGISQKHKGNKLLKQIGESPDEAIPDEVLQNQRMAQINAATGLPSEQYGQAMRNIQRQQMQALSASQDRRGGLANIGRIQQGTNDANLNLDVQNANARLKNQNTLYGINNQVAGWKDKVWRNNVADKWNRKYQYGQSLLGTGNQNLAGGIDQLAAGGLMYGMSGGFGGGNRGNGNVQLQGQGYYAPNANSTYDSQDYQLPG